nr:hypothetical protein BaRGS_033510 [Batillaria attramentaria]
MHATTAGANFPIKGFMATEGGAASLPGNANETKISFAPGTAFDKRGGGGRVSKGGGAAAAAALNLRPVTSGERVGGKKLATPQFKIRPPKATLPTLHYLSVSQEDFLDPRYAEDIVKSYGIPRYFFRSKSNLLVPRTPSRPPLLHGTHTSGDVPQEEQKPQNEKERLEREAENVRPMTSDATVQVMTIKAYNRLPNVVPVAVSSAAPGVKDGGGAAVTSSTDGTGGDVTRKNDSDAASSLTQFPKMVPVYRPLVGDKYTQARFFPPMNPYRSLQLESEVTKYVEHKKRVGQGKYVRFSDSDKPSSSLLREASMYDLNKQAR